METYGGLGGTGEKDFPSSRVLRVEVEGITGVGWSRRVEGGDERLYGTQSLS